MRTKKSEVEIKDVQAKAKVQTVSVPASGFDVVFRFQKRENAESFIAKVKTFGYDNSELREV